MTLRALECGNGHDTTAQPSQSSTIEVAGVVKWFDFSKGFGFVAPDGGGADVLLHATCLQRDGYRRVLKGARIVVAAASGQKGPYAVRVISIDETAVTPAPAPKHVRQPILPTSQWERATVKWFNRLGGYGFLACGAATGDIFIHMEVVRRCGMLDLAPDGTVWVRYGVGPKGLAATEVRSSDPSGSLS